MNDPLGGCETYQLSISNQNKLHASYDPDVKNTTLVIVDEFFRENLDGLLYLCDTSDSREAARNRLFLRWFEESAEPERFTIKTASAVIEGQGIYAAIIVENRNPLAKAIVDDFELTAQRDRATRKMETFNFSYFFEYQFLHSYLYVLGALDISYLQRQDKKSCLFLCVAQKNH